MTEVNETTVKPAQANVGSWFSRAWQIVSADLTTFVFLALIYVAIIGVASSTVIGGFLVDGPLTVGFFIIIFNKFRGKPINIGDIAKGFDYFVAAMLSSILISVFAAIGFVFCIIPGIIISALYVLTPAFIAEKNLDFWEAMETARKTASAHVFELSIFILLIFMVNLAGLLACVVGLLVTIPLTFVATAIAYDDLVGINKEEQQDRQA
jgi:uncharacterized membrane protein